MATYDKSTSSDGLIEKLVAVNRTSKVVKGGRVFGFTATVVVGDGKGKIGYGRGKAREEYGRLGHRDGQPRAIDNDALHRHQGPPHHHRSPGAGAGRGLRRDQAHAVNPGQEARPEDPSFLRRRDPLPSHRGREGLDLGNTDIQRGDQDPQPRDWHTTPAVLRPGH